MYTDGVLQEHLARIQLMTELQHIREVQEAAMRACLGASPTSSLGPSASELARAHATAVAEARQRLVGSIVGPGAIFGRS